MKIQKKWVAALLPIFLLSCAGSQDDKGPKKPARASRPLKGGIGVGNKIHQSEYGFSVIYPEEITFDLQGKDFLHFTNPRGIAADQNISEIRITVLPKQSAPVESLSEVLRQRFPNQEVKREGLSGQAGVRTELRDDKKVQATFLVNTPKGDLLQIDVDVKNEGNGFQKVLPILDNIFFDVEPPFVEQITLSGRGTPTDPLLVKFFATDNQAGIPEIEPRLYVGLNAKNHHIRATLSSGHIRLDDEGAYVIPVVLSSHNPTDTYAIHDFYICDAVNNCDSFSIYGYSTYFGNTGLELPSFDFQSYGAVDVRAPVITEMDLQPVVKAGEWATLRIKVSEDVSGVALGLRPQLHFSQALRTLQFITDDWTDEGNGWFRTRMKIGEFIPSGKFPLYSIDITDNAGNHRIYDKAADGSEPDYLVDGNERGLKFRRPTLEVVNEGISDLKGPDIQEIKTPNTFTRNSSSKFLIKVTDSGSGLESGYVHGYFQNKNFPQSGAAGFSFSGKVTPEGDDWYSVEVQVGAYAPPGEYTLEGFSAFDNAENVRTYSFFPEHSSEHYSEWSPDFEPTHRKIPVLRIRVQ
jgi:hypothetical protein